MMISYDMLYIAETEILIEFIVKIDICLLETVLSLRRTSTYDCSLKHRRSVSVFSNIYLFYALRLPGNLTLLLKDIHYGVAVLIALAWG